MTSNERLKIGQFVTAADGNVESHLNISSVHTNDGGLYTCIASSKVVMINFNYTQTIHTASPYFAIVCGARLPFNDLIARFLVLCNPLFITRDVFFFQKQFGFITFQ